MSPSTIHLIPSNRPTTRAIGVNYYQENAKRLPIGETTLQLIPEPDNPYDARAISVRHQGNVIGYIPSDETSKYWQSVARIARHKKVPVARARVKDLGSEWPYVEIYIKAGKASLPANLQNSPTVKPSELPNAYQRTTALVYGQNAKKPARSQKKHSINDKKDGQVDLSTRLARNRKTTNALLAAGGCAILTVIGVPWFLTLIGLAVALFYIFKKDRPEGSPNK